MQRGIPKLCISGSASHMLTTLLACIAEWYPSGAIDYRRRDRSLVELTRFPVPAFPLNDEATAECFGLEITCLLVDVYYRNWRLSGMKRRKGLFNGASAAGKLCC